MTKRSGIVNERINNLDKKSKQILEEFLEYYSSSNYYKTAVSMLTDIILHKYDVCLINFEDYLKIKNSGDIAMNSRKYMLSFIKYLYSFDYIGGEEFDREFNKAYEKERFIIQKNRVNGTDKSDSLTPPNNDNTLTYDKIMKITELLREKETSSEAMIKYSFYWYLLFELGIDVTKINKLRLDTAFDGVNLNLEGYIQNEKYIDLLNELAGHTYGNKTVKLNVYETKKIGDLVGIDNLKPTDINNARNTFMLIKCPRCLNSVLNFSDNWRSFGNILVCKECSEVLKKNGNIIGLIENHEIEMLSKSEKDERAMVSQTYDEMRSKIKEVDYLSIHKWNIEIGKLGEAFVFDIEYNKLYNTKWAKYIDKSKALDAKNGYDILSFDENGREIYIEVKTTAGKEDTDFYISAEELKMAKKLKDENKKYIIYRVYNILANDKSDISYTIHEDVFDINKFTLIPCNYKVILNKSK